jgi:acyl carrier protein phosphodiesterase
VNYLAHLYLAGENPDLIIGNFIADHIKGNGIEKYNDSIRAGIRMHRAIDEFTDNHPVVRQSIERLRPSYRKYSGVIVDMYYDHFLASTWKQWSAVSLANFTASRYDILFHHFNILPARAQRILPHMARHNWLMAYGEFEGLQRALTGMSNRTPFISRMEHAVHDLQNSYEYYHSEFQEYFPELCNFVKADYGKLLYE